MNRKNTNFFPTKKIFHFFYPHVLIFPSPIDTEYEKKMSQLINCDIFFWGITYFCCNYPLLQVLAEKDVNVQILK